MNKSWVVRVFLADFAMVSVLGIGALALMLPSCKSKQAATTKPQPTGQVDETSSQPTSQSATTKPQPTAQTAPTKPRPTGQATTSKPSPASQAAMTKPQPASQAAMTKPPVTSQTVTTKPEPASQTGSAKLPDATALQEATKLINEVYGTEIAEAIGPEEKSDFAKKLLQAAIDTKSDPAGRYVLLMNASDMAGQAGDTETAFVAFDEFVSAFQTDCLKPKVDMLTHLATIPRANNHSLLERTNRLIDEAVVADRYDVALTLAQQAATFAKKTKDFDTIKATDARQTEVATRKVAHEEVEQVQVILSKNLKDAAANLVVGRYNCFVKGDWEKGLPLLAAHSEKAMRALAEKEMAKPILLEQRLALADGWWDLGQQEQGIYRQRIREHAAAIYRKALPELTGLAKAKTEKRVAEVVLHGQLTIVGREPFQWTYPGQSIQMLRTGQGFAVLTGVNGEFLGGGEEARVSLDTDGWHLSGRTMRGFLNVWGEAIRVAGGSGLVLKEHAWANNKAPVKLIHKDMGFCFLSGMTGAFKGGGEIARVYIDADGYWYLKGQSNWGPLQLWAYSVQRPSDNMRLKYTEYRWANTGEPNKMIHKDRGFCYLSGISGAFNGGGELARVYVGKDGFWYLDAQTRAGFLAVWAIAVEDNACGIMK